MRRLCGFKTSQLAGNCLCFFLFWLVALAYEWIQGGLFMRGFYEGLRWGLGRSRRDGTNVEFGFWDVCLHGWCCMEDSLVRGSLLLWSSSGNERCLGA